jgi:hypothetical protein
MQARFLCAAAIVLLLISRPVTAGNVVISAKDHRGPATCTVFYLLWDEARRDYIYQNHVRLLDGRISLHLAPGRYQFKVRYLDTLPDQMQTIEDVEVSEDGYESLDFAFGAGTATVSVKDYEGPAGATLYLYKWEDERRDYRFIESIVVPGDSGETPGELELRLSPGKYRFKLRYRKTIPIQFQQQDDIVITDTETTPVEITFGRGELSVEGRNNNGLIPSLFYFYRWEDSISDYKYISNNSTSGKADVSLAPGRYRIKVRNLSTKQMQQTDDIVVEDKSEQSRSWLFE